MLHYCIYSLFLYLLFLKFEGILIKVNIKSKKSRLKICPSSLFLVIQNVKDKRIIIIALGHRIGIHYRYTLLFKF